MENRTAAANVGWAFADGGGGELAGGTRHLTGENGLPRSWLLVALAVAVASGAAGSFVAGLNGKGLVAAFGFLGLLVAVALVRDRRLFFLVVLLATLPVELRVQLSSLERVVTGAAGWYLSSTDLILVLAYAVWVVQGSFIADFRRTFFSLPNLLALFVIVATLPSLVNAESMDRSVWELSRMVRVWALFYYGLNCFKQRRYAAYVLGALLFTALMESGFAIAQAITKKGIILELLYREVPLYIRPYAGREVVRVSGTLVEPNTFAALMTVVGAVALGIALFERRNSVRAIAALAYAGVVVSTALSVSRSGVIGLALATALVPLLGLATRRMSLATILYLSLAVAVVGGSAWYITRDAMSAKLEDQAWEWEGRLKLHETALRIFAEHPLVGKGLNNFQYVQKRYEPRDVVVQSGLEVHSLYLLLLAEVGLVGLSALLVYLYYVYRAALPLAWSGDTHIAALSIGLIAGFSGMYLADVLSFALRLEVTMKLYWLLSSLLFSWSLFNGRSK